ncbi:MAG: hypothetical protein IIC13_13970 [SAR324 cluster bacterium]|nr:hypothetical protein [SAR324 cluster bacterium]
MLFHRSIFALMNSMATGHTLAISAITVLMILRLGSIALGLGHRKRRRNRRRNRRRRFDTSLPGAGPFMIGCLAFYS